jgi:hypothetical protein
MREVAKMGLSFGVDSRQMKALGQVGQTLVSRSTMGSKALPQGDVVVTFGGPLPGCRVILLSAATGDLIDALRTKLVEDGWRAAPTSGPQTGAVTRAMLVRRDAAGTPYLINIMGLSDPTSSVRLFTTTIRIPDGVHLPPGF